MDRLRKKLPGKPSRSVVFGLAGLRHTKMLWMRRKPDLRISVVAKLAKALGVPPESFFRMILDEETKLSRSLPKRPAKPPSAKRRLAEMTRAVAGETHSS